MNVTKQKQIQRGGEQTSGMSGERTGRGDYEVQTTMQKTNYQDMLYSTRTIVNIL